MLKYVAQKLVFICMGVSISLVSVCVFAEKQQVLRLLVWEGCSGQLQPDTFFKDIS
jgi:hypothetical protein